MIKNILILFISLSFVFSNTHLVPSEFPTIQSAVIYADDGDTVFVASGTYYESFISVSNKTISIIGENPNNTILHGENDSYRCLNIDLVYSPNKVFTIQNFTITNYTNNNGAALNLGGGNGIINNCIIKNNSSPEGAIYVTGGGSGSSILNITNSVISNNTSAFYILNSSDVFIDKSTIYGNNENSFLYLNCSSSSVNFSNSILWNNNGWSTSSGGCDIDNGHEIFMNYSNSENSQYGIGLNNISENPQFVDPENGYFTLEPSSACIDAGDPSSELDPDGTRADMGAYYFHQGGCTDSLADNYNQEANIDDGSCEYPNNGDYVLSFDGDDDRVELPGSIFYGLDQLTFSSWFYKDNVDSRIQTIIQQNHGLYIRYETNEGNPQFSNVLWVDGQGSYQVNVDAPESYQWHNLSLTYNGDTIIAYLNGEQIGNINVSGSIFNNQDIIYIGNYLTQEGFGGYIDEISIWDIALNQEQIQSNILNYSTNIDESLVGYWKFNAGSGDVLYDHSGNQNHGAIYGATWTEHQEDILGCTDEYACNYNLDANVDDNNCDYSCFRNGSSLNFNGQGDWVEINDSESLTMVENFSVIVWVEPEFTEGNLHYAVLSKGWNGESSDCEDPTITQYHFSLSRNNEAYNLKPHYLAQDCHWNNLHGSATINDNESYMLSSVFSTDSYISYVNNQIDNSATMAYGGPTIDLPGSLRFSSYSGNNSDSGGQDYYYEGKILKSVIINETLSSEEIYEIYNTDGENLDQYNVSALYYFESGSGDILIDHSGNQNHGTIHGATWEVYEEPILGCTDPLAENYNSDANIDDASCNYHENGDYSLSFDGQNDYVSINVSIVDDFTFSGWINFDDINTADVILGGSNSALIRLGGSDGSYTLGYNSPNGGNPQGAIVVPQSEWVHIAVLRQEGNMSFYINGILDIEFSEGVYPINFNTIVSESASMHFWKGKVDNFGIWDRALSIDEIQNQINNSEDSLESALAYWTFDSGEGTILYDQSGNQNHGTIYGATWELYQEDLEGCTDPLACNYNSDANVDDGSCEYPSCNDNGDFVLSFDGVDDYVASDNFFTDFSSDGVAIKTTFKTNDSVSQSSHPKYFVSQYNPSGSDAVELGIWQNQLWVHIRGNNGAMVGDIGSYYGYGSDLADGNWHTAKVIYDGANNYLTVRIDDVVYFSDYVEEIGDLTSSSPIYLGAQQNHGHYFNGSIKEVEIWDAAVDLSDDSINNDQHLILEYRINEGNGNNIVDYSGNRYHGTIYGATWEVYEEPILGCTDELACNYNEEATGNDGSCEYPEEFYNCDGGCINDSDSDLICDENDSCPLDPENDIDEDGLCCSDSSYLFFDSNDNVSLTAFDLTNSSVTFSFDVILEGDSHIFGQHNDGHLKIGYYSFPAFTGTQVPDNTNYIALSTWQGGPWDQLVIYEDDIEGGFDNQWHNITVVYVPGGISRLYYDYDLKSEGYISGANTPGGNGFNGLGSQVDSNEQILSMKSANIWHGSEISHQDIVDNQENLISAITPTNGWDFSAIENNVLIDLYGENNGTVEGATIENYSSDICCNDPDNDIDGNGLCADEEVYGCDDEYACNYNSDANVDDGSCEYPQEFYNCDGGCINDSDSDLICDENDSCPLDPENDIDGDGLCCDSNITQTENYGLEFNSNDWINFGPDVGNIEDATIQIRFKFDCDECGVNGSYLSPGEYQNLAIKEVSGNNAWGISVHGDSEFPNQTAVGSWFSDGRTHAPIENNTWYNISITRNSSNGVVQLYLNNTLVDEDILVPGLKINTSDFLIGSHNQNNDNLNFDGIIDYVRIWDRVLSQEDIDLYNSDLLTGSESGLVNYWDFNQIESAIDNVPVTIVDQADNAPNGTIFGNPQYVQLNNPISDLCCSDPFNDIDGDGICADEEVYGCDDESACNTLEDATENDGSCEYPEEFYNCNNECINDLDSDLICDEFEIVGCQDESACNYNISATDSGECVYAEENYDCDGNCITDIDCDGICGGGAVVDDCGMCNGENYFNEYGLLEDGSCDCESSTLDCSGICGGGAILDDCGICDDDDDNNNLCYAPIIENIWDVPNDQGGRVYIKFNKSYFDTDTLITRIESYQVERWVGNVDPDDMYNWVGVGTYNAYSSDSYTMEVTTLSDSNSVDLGISEFRVIANMEEGNFVGESAFGYSVDNINPSTPSNFVSSYENESIILSWDHINDTDFQYYSIFRDGEFVTETIENTYVHIPETEEIELSYTLLAVDVNGNQSDLTITEVLQTDYSLGDINQDNSYNVLDVVLMVDVIIENYYGGESPSSYVLWSCDLTDDDFINVIDIVALINIIMDIDFNFLQDIK